MCNLNHTVITSFLGKDMLEDNERVDHLIKEGYEIIQNDEVFSFSTDALLLGYLTEVRKMIKLWIYVPAMVLFHYY